MTDFRVGVHSKITKEERVDEILSKAKEMLAEVGENNNVVQLKDETEEVKVKKPKATEEKTKMPMDANDAFAGDLNEG